LFGQSADIYAAIKALTTHSQADGQAIDPAAVVKELIEHYPDTSLSPAALLEEVTRCAAEVGLRLRVKVAE
jgi:hypothetical protein